MSKRNPPRAGRSNAIPPAKSTTTRRPHGIYRGVGLVGVIVVALAGWLMLRSRAPETPTASTSAAAPRDTAAEQLLAKCTAAGVDAEQCLQSSLDGTLRSNGQRAAFGLLVAMRNSPKLAGKDHALAHHLGRLAYDVVGDPARALADCPGEMGSGCLHGVVEGYFLAKGANASVVGLCSGAAAQSPQAMHQCWHGVGHGLYMAHGYDWAPAVKQCEPVPEMLDRVNCASGVFMQFGMDDGHGDANMASMPGMAGMDDASHSGPKIPKEHVGDLLYPCNQLTQREVAIGCWQMQPFAVLKLTHGSFERAFWACAQSGPYQVMCEEGVGQAAGAQSRIDSQSPLTFCDASKDKGPWRNCMIGAIKDIVVQAHSIAPGVAICRLTNADVARDCYGAVGVMNLGMQPNTSLRIASCSGVPALYRDACAGLFAQPRTNGPAPAGKPTGRSSPPPLPDAPSAPPRA